MELLEFCGIKDHPTWRTWRTWAMKNHPDRGGDNDKYVIVKMAFAYRHAKTMYFYRK